MSTNGHSPHRENIPAYALGALDVADAAALEAHLETCASCQTELAEYRHISESLLMASPPQSPSQALRNRLQARIASPQKPPRPQARPSFGRLAAGFAVVTLAVLNLLTLLQLRQVQDRQASLQQQVADAQVALAALSSGEVQMLPVQGAVVSGSMLLNQGQNTAVLIVHNLPMPAANEAYQIWLIKPDGRRVSAGLFRPADSDVYTTQSIIPAGSFADYVGLGVTVEPQAGSSAPTGERVLKVDF